MACEVELFGFQPEGFVQQLTEDLEKELETILDAAPSDACANVTIRRGREGFMGILDIHSEQGQFVAKSWAPSVNEVRNDLVDQINNQLDSWRERRFTKDDTFLGEVAWLGTGHHHGAA